MILRTPVVVSIIVKALKVTVLRGGGKVTFQGPIQSIAISSQGVPREVRAGATWETPRPALF